MTHTILEAFNILDKANQPATLDALVKTTGLSESDILVSLGKNKGCVTSTTASDGITEIYRLRFTEADRAALRTQGKYAELTYMSERFGHELMPIIRFDHIGFFTPVPYTGHTSNSAQSIANEFNLDYDEYDGVANSSAYISCPLVPNVYPPQADTFATKNLINVLRGYGYVPSIDVIVTEADWVK